MKTASVNYQNTLITNRIYAPYQFEFNKLIKVRSYIMNKLTAVSPFLLLLVPAFVLIAVTLLK